MFIDILFYEARRTTVKIYKINSVSEPIWFFLPVPDFFAGSGSGSGSNKKREGFQLVITKF